ncbi:MAG: ATP-binding cassette domain-containing protein [Chloroflexota bacterium]|nr:ATP-binding cassette domain-containing protein [Chloroflexota bacterium]
MPAIVAEALVKHFSADIRAVDGIDLAIDEGQIFGFLGANGSGKTTTVRMLTTLLRPTAGRAEVLGMDVGRQATAVRRSIGVALQEAGLDDIQTGRELLTLQARLYRVPPGELKQRVSELLRIVDLDDAADRRVKTYSGGMRRRLDLAAALVHRPKVVFLDEPTSGLDPISREAIWRYVSELNKSEGVTFFLTTQYLEEADRMADEVAIMDAGRIVAQGSPAALKSSIGTDVVTLRIEGGADELSRAQQAVRRLEGVEDVRIVDDAVIVYVREGSTAIAKLVLLLDEASLRAREVTLAQPTLDDVFLQKTGHHLEAADAQAARGAALGTKA